MPSSQRTNTSKEYDSQLSEMATHSTPVQDTIDHSSTQDDSWEDIDEEQEDQQLTNDTQQRTSGATSSHTPSRTVRKRKVQPQKRATPARRTAQSVSPPSVPEPAPAPRRYIGQQELVDGAVDGVTFTLQYVFDVFSTAVRLLKRPLNFIVFLWLLAFILSYISSTLRSAFLPLCYVPGLYGSRFCTDPVPKPSRKGPPPPRWADYPRLIDVQSATFEHLLDEAVGGSGLSLEIKKAEMATSDLVTLVRASNLKSKEMLADALSGFVSDAKKTSRDLTKLSSKIGGAVDNIMAVNDYALHEIETAQSYRPGIETLYGLIPSGKPSTKEIVVRTFDEAMSVLSIAMERLILEAEVNLANLGNLEQRLDTLHKLIHREDSSTSDEKDDVLRKLWTKLGGNKKLLRKFEMHLALLKNLGMYRKKALAHVMAALQSLEVMSGDMEDLRERVAAPELAGSTIPVQVHMKSIRGGLDRLKEGRVRAKQLEQEAINKVLGLNSHEVLD